MWNMFEHPWLLLLVGFAAFLVIGTLHSVYPEKQRRKHWLIPAVILFSAFAVDYLVPTDPEKIRATLHALLSAAQQHDVRAINRLVAPDYQDSYHASKQDLMRHIESRLSRPTFEKIRQLSAMIPPLDGPSVLATLNLGVRFDKDSDVAKQYKPFLLALVRFRLDKQPDTQWRITCMELLEVDKQPVNWGYAASRF